MIDKVLNTPVLLFMVVISKWDHIAQKMKFSVKDFFSKCDQIRSILRIWSHLLKISLMKNFIFCAVPAKLTWFIETLSQ